VKVLYIAGYGRSGSTLLERILSGNRAFLATGELVNLPARIASDQARCSCGEALTACPVWGPVLESLPPGVATEIAKAQREIERLTSGLLSGLIGVRRQRYLQVQRLLFEAVEAAAPAGARILIDSSKTAWKAAFRPITLSRVAGLDVVMIHLVRDGRGCMWSNLRGSNRRLEVGEDARIRFAAIRTALSWFLANLAALLGRVALGPKRYLMVRYEDLVEAPAETLSRIGTYLGVDLSEEVDRLAREESVSHAHQITGNRMRSEQRLTLRLDDEWKSNLGLSRQALHLAINWPLHLAYRRRACR